jgi:3-dehydroquinate dehydratase-2
MELTTINGPNLNLLGKREPEIYGSKGFEAYLSELKQAFPQCTFHYVQSNIEGELIDALHKYGFSSQGIILNAGAYTHTSVGIGDAVKAIESPVVEVHISNTFAREDFRHTSFITPNAAGLILGFGLDVYRLAADSFVNR